jgi:hypothetical protein
MIINVVWKNYFEILLFFGSALLAGIEFSLEAYGKICYPINNIIG